MNIILSCFLEKVDHLVAKHCYLGRWQLTDLGTHVTYNACAHGRAWRVSHELNIMTCGAKVYCALAVRNALLVHGSRRKA
jgi:hypothetical protein